MQSEADRACISARPSSRRLGSATCPSSAPSVASSAIVQTQAEILWCSSKIPPASQCLAQCRLGQGVVGHELDILVTGCFRQEGMDQHWCTGAAASKPPMHIWLSAIGSWVRGVHSADLPGQCAGCHSLQSVQAMNCKGALSARPTCTHFPSYHVSQKSQAIQNSPVLQADKVLLLMPGANVKP